MPGKGNNKSTRSKRGQYEVVQATPLEYRPVPQPELPEYFEWHAFTVEFWDSLKEHPTLQNLTKTQWQFFILSVIMPIEEAARKFESGVSTLRSVEVAVSSAREFILSPKSIAGAKIELLTAEELQRRLAEHTQKAPTPRHVEGNATYGELRLEA